MATFYTDWTYIAGSDAYYTMNFENFNTVAVSFPYRWRIKAVEEEVKTYLQVQLTEEPTVTVTKGTRDDGGGFADGVCLYWASDPFNFSSGTQGFYLDTPSWSVPADQWTSTATEELLSPVTQEQIIGWGWGKNDGTGSRSGKGSNWNVTHEWEIANDSTSFNPLGITLRHADWVGPRAVCVWVDHIPLTGGTSGHIDFIYYPAAVDNTGAKAWLSTNRKLSSGNKAKFWIRSNATTWRECPCYFDTTSLTKNKLHIKGDSSWQKSGLYGNSS